MMKKCSACGGTEYLRDGSPWHDSPICRPCFMVWYDPDEDIDCTDPVAVGKLSLKLKAAGKFPWTEFDAARTGGEVMSYETEQCRAAQVGRIGADRMALGLPCIPDRDRGDMEEVMRLREVLALMRKRLDWRESFVFTNPPPQIVDPALGTGSAIASAIAKAVKP